MKRVAIPTALLAGAGLLTSACGSSDTAAPGPSSMSSLPAGPQAPTGSAKVHRNGHDVMFAQMMVPHQRQALRMVKLAEKGATSSKVKELAKQIKAAQDPRIRAMSGWLESWGAPKDGMTMDHGMPGMMPEQDMKKLEGLKGAAFDKAFLMTMIQHHLGAITMAKQEQAGGVYQPAMQMAQSIISSYPAEISAMKTLL